MKSGYIPDLGKDLEQRSSFAKVQNSTFCADSCRREQGSAGLKAVDVVGTQVGSELEIKLATIFQLYVDKCRREVRSFDWRQNICFKSKEPGRDNE